MGVKYRESLLPSCIGIYPKKTTANIESSTAKCFGRALKDLKAQCIWLVGHQIFPTEMSFENKWSLWHSREKPQWSLGVFQCAAQSPRLYFIPWFSIWTWREDSRHNVSTEGETMSFVKGGKMRLQWVRSQKALILVTGVREKICVQATALLKNAELLCFCEM